MELFLTAAIGITCILSILLGLIGAGLMGILIHSLWHMAYGIIHMPVMIAVLPGMIMIIALWLMTLTGPICNFCEDNVDNDNDNNGVIKSIAIHLFAFAVTHLFETEIGTMFRVSWYSIFLLEVIVIIIKKYKDSELVRWLKTEEGIYLVSAAISYIIVLFLLCKYDPFNFFEKPMIIPNDGPGPEPELEIYYDPDDAMVSAYVDPSCSLTDDYWGFCRRFVSKPVEIATDPKPTPTTGTPVPTFDDESPFVAETGETTAKINPDCSLTDDYWGFCRRFI